MESERDYPERRGRHPGVVTTPVRDHGAYCRDIETYLCQKNRGHLIRIVGPAFGRVRGWAEAGVPMQVVTRGIDRKLDRSRAVGRPRRPVRIEHCEADILDAFDEWRRAVGVTAGAAGEPTGREPGARGPATATRRGPSLPAHIDRVLTQATTLLALGEAAAGLHAALEELVADLDALRSEARGARGTARAVCLGRLAGLDQRFLERARAAAGTALDELVAEADRELAPFKPRMAAPVYARARSTAADRLLRERFRLPTVHFDQ